VIKMLQDVKRKNKYEIDIFNSSVRLPICMCLDTSYSMGGFKEGIEKASDYMGNEPIQYLKNAVLNFLNEIYKIKETDNIETSIITFNSEVEVLFDFGSTKIQKSDFNDINEIIAEGVTLTSDAIDVALHVIEERKNIYRNQRIDYFQPWIVLFTDGIPCNGDDNNDDEEFKTLKKIKTLQNMAEKEQLVLIPIAIGNDIKTDFMEKIRSDKAYVRIDETNQNGFQEFFEYLKKSSETPDIDPLSKSVVKYSESLNIIVQ